MFDAFALFGFELFQCHIHEVHSCAASVADSTAPVNLRPSRPTLSTSKYIFYRTNRLHHLLPYAQHTDDGASILTTMQAHIIQLNIAWEDKSANYQRVNELLEAATISPNDLIVLPELFDVGFTLNAQIASDAAGTTRVFLQELADKTNCTIHGSRAVPDPDSGKLHNCATITTPGQSSPTCEYAKFHPFSLGREGETYAAGNELKCYQWVSGDQALTVVPTICYDLRFPELFRMGLHHGAQAFVMGANWPTARIEHWRTLCIARAIENQAYIIAANRTGNDPHLSYPGNSIVVDPKGKVIAELGDEETVVSVEINPQEVIDWRMAFPALNDIKLI